jgi:putative transposase
VIDRLVDAGVPLERCCRVLGISRQNYYKHKRRPTTATQLRRQWLTGLIREIHVASRGTYGYRRIHAELTLGMGITVCPRTVSVLMTVAGIYGLPGPVRAKRLRGVVTADDLVNRKFHRLAPNELWVTDITQHRTREGRLYCCAVLDAFSRRIVGWSMDSRADSTLVVNALDMAIRNRRPTGGGIVHADHGTQFTSWVFGEKIRAAGLVPSFGSIGDGLDNAMMESFWSSMQIELLDRQKWKTRWPTPSSTTSRSSTTANAATQHWATAPRSNTNYPSPTTPSPPSVSHPGWNPTGRSGQDVTYSCSRPGPATPYGELANLAGDLDSRWIPSPRRPRAICSRTGAVPRPSSLFLAQHCLGLGDQSDTFAAIISQVRLHDDCAAADV